MRFVKFFSGIPIAWPEPKGDGFDVLMGRRLRSKEVSVDDLFEILREIDPIDQAGMESIETMVAETRELTRLPPVALKILKLADDPNSTAQEMERVISSDPASVALLLKIANSSFYGLSRQVDNLQRAILIIGFKTIRDLVIASSVLRRGLQADGQTRPCPLRTGRRRGYRRAHPEPGIRGRQRRRSIYLRHVARPRHGRDVSSIQGTIPGHPLRLP